MIPHTHIPFYNFAHFLNLGGVKMPSGKRRPKGEGSITVLPSGKVRIRVELDPVDGKRRWLTATADTKKAAVEKLKELQRTKEDNVLQTKAAEDTLDYQLQRYVSYMKAQGLAGATISLTKRAVGYLKDSVHNKLLSTINSEDIDTLLLTWRQQQLKGRTIANYMSRLKMFFAWCLEQDVIKKTPILAIHKSVKAENPKLNLITLSMAEHESIKAYLLTYWERRHSKQKMIFKMYALYCLVYETGMREGEILVLTWDNLDAANNNITVNKTLAKDENNRFIITLPKTAAGNRTIKISEDTTQLLEALRPEDTTKEPYIFYNPRTATKHYTVRVLYATWERIKRVVGITRPFTFHDLRHTNASNMIHQKVPIALITKRLGHTSIMTTYNVYGHIIQECEEANVAVIKA